MRLQQKQVRKHRTKTVALLLILSFLIAMLPTFMLSAEADTEEITIVREEVDRRNANERHYLCSDGSIMAVAFSGDVHYLDADGIYRTINNTLVYNAAKGQYRSVGNPNFTVTFGSDAKAPYVCMTDADGNTVLSSTTVAIRTDSVAAMQALTAQAATLSVHNEEKIEVNGKNKASADVLAVPENHAELHYNNTFGSGISAEYALDGYSLKENVVFEYPVNYTAIETRYAMDGLWVDVNDDGSLILYNAENEAVYTVTTPYMYDAAGSECPSVDVQVALEGDTVVVRYIPDEAWRNSAERVYPVVFDPLTTPQTYNNINDMYSTVANGSFNGVTTNTTELMSGVKYYSTSGSYNGLQHVYRTSIKPTVYPYIPVGNTVQHLQLVLTAKDVEGSGSLQFHKLIAGDFTTGNYTMGEWLGATGYSDATPQNTYSFNLPTQNYENSEYIIREVSEAANGSAGAHYITFHSSRAVSSSNRPKIIATYVPTGIDGKITALYNTSAGKYITAPTNNSIQATDTVSANSLWKFWEDDGSFRILSQYHSGKCLGVDENNNLILTDTSYSSNANNILWYVLVSGDTYAIVNETKTFYLYIDENGAFRIGTPSSSGYQWETRDLVSGLDGASPSLANSAADGFLIPETETTVSMVSGITEDVPWEFVSTGNNTFRIVPGAHTDKALAGDATGGISLVARSTSSSDTAQLWYVTENGNGYSIMNVKYQSYLYAQNQNGTRTCGLSGTEAQTWMFMDYDVPEVAKIKNVALNQYLLNVSGLNYDGETIGIGTYDSTDVYDKFGFRLVYLQNEDAYKIAPISSCNGYYRVLTNNGANAVVRMYSYNKTNPVNQLYKLTLQSDGNYMISLNSNANQVLTGSGSNVTMSSKTAALTNQTWCFELYQYTSRQSTDASTTGNYSEVEAYYKSLGFRSPYRTTEEDDDGNVSIVDENITVTSGFKKRLKKKWDSDLGKYIYVEDSHEGLDISGSAGTSLFGVSTGKVVYIDNVANSDAGRYIVVESDYYEYRSDGQQIGRKIYYIYMHMQSISVALNTEITEDNIDTLVLGKVGTSGNGDGVYTAHLHWGVFLEEAGLDNEFANHQPWQKNVSYKSTINPFLFFVPSSCRITDPRT